MTILRTFIKHPDAVKNYTIDFASWLESGDAIASAAAVETGGDTVVDSTTYTDDTAVVWLSGGTEGDLSTITVTITTDNGLTEVQTFRVKIKE